MSTVQQDTPRKSAWIPWVFVAAMGLVVVVNGVMVTFAVKSWTGLTVSKPYERGIQYNQVLEAKRAQDALGWTFASSFGVTGDGLHGRVLIKVTGRDGAPMDDLSLTGALVRPIEVMAPLELSFEPVGDGRYVARADLPKAGQWDLKVTARRGDDEYLLIERLVVR